MSTGCYDRQPTPSRAPIVVAGDLVRRDDKLSKEAAKMIRDLVQVCHEFTSFYAADTNHAFVQNVKRLLDGGCNSATP